MNKFLKILLGFIFFIIAILYFVSGYIFFNIIFFSKSFDEQKDEERRNFSIKMFIENILSAKPEEVDMFIRSYNKNKENTPEFIEEEKKRLFSYLNSYLNKEELILKSQDNLKLKGYLLKNNLNEEDSDKFVIIAHAYKSSHNQLILNAFEFYKMGFNVVLLDLRGHGNSEGNYTTLCIKEGKDIRDWINHIAYLYPNSKIITYGISMGASSVLSACGEKLSNNFKLCIADCPFDSLDNTIFNVGKLSFGIPSFLISLIISSVNIYSHIINGVSVYYNISDILHRSKVPILFIHSEKDYFVPVYNSYHMYNNYKNEKNILIIKNAGHVEGFYVDKMLYMNSIKEMIDKYL